MFFLVFLMDLVYDIAREIIAIVEPNSGPESQAAIKTLTTFWCVLALLLIIPAVIQVCTTVTPHFTTVPSMPAFIPWFLQLLVVMMYFYSDNINHIMQRYSQQLNCSEACRERNRVISMTLLFLAPLILNNIPQQNKSPRKSGKSKLEVKLHYAFGIAALLVKTDMLNSFSIIVLATSTKCSTADDWSLVLVLFIFSTIFLCAGVFCNWSYTERFNVYQTKKFNTYIILVAVLLLLGQLMHLLADVQQPLDCTLGCHSSTTDVRTAPDAHGGYTCMQVNIILRLGLTGMYAVLTLGAVALLVLKMETEKIPMTTTSHYSQTHFFHP